MKFLLVFLLLLGLGACNQTDSTRLDTVEHDGKECVVVRSGMGKIIAVDCNWEGK